VNPTSILKAAVILTFFNSWVLFAELVIDRHGLAPYLPFYRIGWLCVWDVLALVLSVLVTRRAFRAAAPATREHS
jgi:hypothetical protein